MADELTLHQRDDLPDDVIDVERPLLNVSLFRERPDATSHFTRPIAIVVGQISRDIGIKLTTQSWYLTTHLISPEVDQLLLFDAGFDLVRSRYTLRLCTWHGRVVDAKSPGNLTGEPYVTDGLRLVLFLNEPRQPFNQIDFLDWERVSP